MARNSSYTSQFDELLLKINNLIDTLSSTKKWDSTVDVDKRVSNIIHDLNQREDGKEPVSKIEQDIINKQRDLIGKFDEANKDYVASLNEYRQNNKTQYDAQKTIIEDNKKILRDVTTTANQKQKAREEIKKAEEEWKKLDEGFESYTSTIGKGIDIINKRQKSLDKVLSQQLELEEVDFRKKHGIEGSKLFNRAKQLSEDAGVAGRILGKSNNGFARGIGKGLTGLSNGLGGALGKATSMLGGFTAGLSQVQAACQLFDAYVGEAAKAIADADAKAQEFQNKKNTILTDHSIALSKVYAANFVDRIDTTLREGLAAFSTESKIAQQQQQIDNKLLTSATEAQIGSVIGNTNDTAWNALSALTDIQTEQAKLDFSSEKERDKTTRSIAQMESEKYNRTELRKSDIEKANLDASQSIARVNIEANQHQKDHYIASTVSGIFGDGIVGQYQEQEQYIGKASAGNNVGSRDNVDAGKYRNMDAGNSTINIVAGALSHLGLENSVQAGYTVAQTKAERDMVNDLNDLKARRASLENQKEMSEEVVSATNQMKDVTIDAQIAMRNATLDTLNNIEKQYQKMAQTIENYALSFQKISLKSGYGKGLTSIGNTQTYSRAMGNTVVDVSKSYGLKAEDIFALQDKSSEGTGRAKIATKTDIDRMAAIGYYLNDNNLAANIASSMEIFNTGIEDAVDGLWTMVNQVNKIGLDSKKYISDVIKNLRLAQSYDFHRGKQGLLEMTKWAQEVRFNMDNLGKMIDDIQGGGLENVITKSAKLQVLGGGFAMGANPLAMIYESFADPQGLAERYNSMIQGIGHLIRDTGEVKIDAIQDQIRLRAYAEYTGQSLEDAHNQVTYNVKKDHVLPFISNSSNLSEEQKRNLVNRAYMKDGEWVVNTLDQRQMRVSDVNNKNVNNVQAENLEDNVSNAISKTVAWQDKMLGLTESQTAYLALAVTANGTLDDNQEARYQKALAYFKEHQDELIGTTETEMGKATKAFEGFLDLVGSAEENEITHLAKLEKLSGDILDVINKMAEKNGVDISQYKKEQFQGYVNNAKRPNNGTPSDPTVNIGGQLYSVKGLHQAGIITGTTEYGNLLMDTKLLQQAFGDNVQANDVKYGEWSRKNFKNNGDKIFVNDGVVSMSSGNVRIHSKDDVTPMYAQAARVTPVHDGAAQIVETDPKDSAIFAKNGGPFDKLFTGVFGKINEVHQVVKSSEELHLETVSPAISSDINTEASSIGLGNTDTTTIEFDKPIEHKFSGSIKLDLPDGSSIDILKEIQNNPIILRALTQLVSEAVSRNINGGKTSFNGGNLVGGFGVSS